MTQILQFFTAVYSLVTALPFTTLLLITLCSFFGIFILSLILSLTVGAFSKASKRPFFALVNVFTGLVLAILSTEYSLSFCIFASAIFWVIGYALYGALTLTYRPEEKKEEPRSQIISAMPAHLPVADNVRPDVPAAKSNVRIDHALSITDKLLLKSLGRGDRQELEKMRHTLSVLQSKGSVTPEEGEILNENFNTLLKLMARYNL